MLKAVRSSEVAVCPAACCGIPLTIFIVMLRRLINSSTQSIILVLGGKVRLLFRSGYYCLER